jgi:DNA-binding transcriptional MerR regulator
MTASSSSAAPLFDDGKADGAMRTIGEVSAAFGIKPHVLRYWEAQFPSLKPLKRSGGRRLYRAEDVAMVDMIDRLVNREGYTLKGAKKALQAGPATAVEVSGPAPAQEQVRESSPEFTTQLRAIRDRLAAALN